MNMSVRNRDYSVEEMVYCSRLLREKLYVDPHRPRFHPIAPEGWTNDANGAIYWNGRYHLFILGRTPLPHRENPGADRWEGRVWFHISSEDLVHWIHHPPALKADENNPDPDYVGPQSGDAIANAPVPALIYHDGKKIGTSIAVAEDDELICWKPLAGNPVIPYGSHPDVKVHDPCAWYRDGVYYALIGGKNYRQGFEGDCTSLFLSRNLVDWEYRGPFYQSRREWTEEVEDCACPDFFPLGDRYMLLMHGHKPYRQAHYYLGRLESERFHPEEHGRMTWPGGQFAGPETMLDDKGRRILFGWIPEGSRSQGGRDWIENGWASCISLPRMLSLEPNGSLRIEPVPELEKLRSNHRRMNNLPITDDAEIMPSGFSGDCLELDARIVRGSTRRVGLLVRCSPDYEEQTRIVFDAEHGSLAIDAETLTGPQGDRCINRQKAPVALKKGEPLRLRVYLDRSVIEVFANDRQCLTQRVYPSRPDSTGVSFLAEGGDDTYIEYLDAWDMKPTGVC